MGGIFEGAVQGPASLKPWTEQFSSNSQTLFLILEPGPKNARCKMRLHFTSVILPPRSVSLTLQPSKVCREEPNAESCMLI